MMMNGTTSKVISINTNDNLWCFIFNKKYLKLENKSWDRNGPVVVCFYLVVLLSSHDHVSSTDYTKEKKKKEKKRERES